MRVICIISIVYPGIKGNVKNHPHSIVLRLYRFVSAFSDCAAFSKLVQLIYLSVSYH